MFQCSSASRKFLNAAAPSLGAALIDVSVLFSEPKIPQYYRVHPSPSTSPRFSALQRAENSSIIRFGVRRRYALCFSALQRAENSSIFTASEIAPVARAFQCSSASRKFLNDIRGVGVVVEVTRFSALQRAENSSMGGRARVRRRPGGFSALQRAENSSIRAEVFPPRGTSAVSVLFSEPKIPQSGRGPLMLRTNAGFSALQRAENSSIGRTSGRSTERTTFQCSSASRKFLNIRW